MVRAIILFLMSLLVVNNSISQQTQIKIVTSSNLPNREEFNTLNSKEISLDQKSKDRRQRRLEEEKLDSTSSQTNWSVFESMYPVYSQNRSRFTIYEFKNKVIEDSIKIDSHSKASCTRLNDSTLTVNTGFGIFGGLYFTIEISGKDFTSVFNLDAGSAKIYKAQLGDSILTHQINVSNSSETMLLDTDTKYNQVEFLNGHLDFTSIPFYRSIDYDPYLSMDNYDSLKVDTMYYIGEIDFTCKVLKGFPDR